MQEAREAAPDEGEPRVLLEETFYASASARRGPPFRVQLTERGLRLQRDGGAERLLAAADLVGCRVGAPGGGEGCACSGSAAAPDAAAYLHVFAYARRRGRRRRSHLTLRFRTFDRADDNAREAQRWRAALRRLLAPGAGRLLVLLNPKSGSGKARELWQRLAAPLLAEAELPYELQVTRHADFARRFVRGHNLYLYSAVVAVGGDGILFEVVNGIFERPDWRQVLEEVPLAIVPCGSGNALARTLCHIFDEPYSRNPIMASTLALVRGQTNAMDVVRVETKTQILFSFLSVGWGLLSDIDIESERLRMIGGQRFTVWSLARLIGLRTYRGKLFYQPTTAPVASPVKVQSFLNHSFSQDGIADCAECCRLGEECENCRDSSNISLETGEDANRETRPRLDSWYSVASKKSTYFSNAGSDYLSVQENQADLKSEPVRMYGPASQLPALTAPVPSSWKSMEGEFILVHAAYQPYLGEDVIFAPESRLDDGVIWLLVIRGGATRTQLLAFLLGLTSGAHAARSNSNSKLQLIPVSAFRIEPEPDPSHPAHITVDGELVAYGPVQAEVCSVQARIVVPSN